MKELLEELKKLNLPADQYAIFGSGPIAIRGLRKADDIDLIVKIYLWSELSKKYHIKEKPILVGNQLTGKMLEYIGIGKIEAFKDWPPFENTNELIENSETIQGFPFVRLEYVLQWKKSRNQEKDKKDIELIENLFHK